MKSKRFEPIHNLADHSAQHASREVAQAASHVEEMQRQLAQLEQYRREYAEKPACAPAAMDAVRLQNFRSFLGRLNEAIRTQSLAVDQAQSAYEVKRAEWAQKRSEADSIGKVVERIRFDERKVQERREQSELDEVSARRISRNKLE